MPRIPPTCNGKHDLTNWHCCWCPARDVSRGRVLIHGKEHVTCYRCVRRWCTDNHKVKLFRGLLFDTSVVQVSNNQPQLGE